MTLSFRTDKSGQTVQTQIRLLLEEQSDQDLHCLQIPLYHFDYLQKMQTEWQTVHALISVNTVQSYHKVPKTWEETML